MAKNYFKFCDVNYDVNDKVSYLDISFYPALQDLDLRTTTITSDERYRPDKIAYRLYENAELYWVLGVVNQFQHSHKDFTINKKIKYPLLSDLEALGII